MASKKKQKKFSAIVLPDQLGMYLDLKMQALKLDVEGYAKKLGVTRQLVYMAKKGSRQPSKELLNKFGLELNYRLPGYAELIAPEQLQMLVVLKMQMSKLGQKGYAEYLGIHEQTLYKIVAGVRLPPKSVIKKLELETVYRIL
jgi:transcriptional regulator with XRE-family HTH domain